MSVIPYNKVGGWVEGVGMSVIPYNKVGGLRVWV